MKFGFGLLVVSAFGAFATAVPAGAADSGDPLKGLEYARAICAECHAVEKTATQSPNPKAPTFVSVAETPGMTGLAIRAWLHSPHPTMPNLLVKPEDQDNLVAYITGLKEK